MRRSHSMKVFDYSLVHLAYLCTRREIVTQHMEFLNMVARSMYRSTVTVALQDIIPPGHLQWRQRDHDVLGEEPEQHQ